MHAFRQAVEANDFEAVEALLAPNVVFFSPVAFAPYEGRPVVAAILRAVFRVFDGIDYVREIENPDGRHAALVFKTRVGGRELEGCDFLTLGDDGLITEFTVMVRPLSAATLLAEAMAAQFERITQEAAQRGGSA